MLWVLVNQIYERSVGDGYPVVEHRFYGKTKAEAMAYYTAHLAADSFIRGCTVSKHYGPIQCKTDMRWEQVAG